MHDFETNSEPKKEAPESNPDSNKKENAVPPQYKGMNSQIVEEAWKNPIYADPEKNRRETERREQAIEQMRREEIGREKGKRESAEEFYRHLPEEQKREFTNSQKESAKSVTDHINGTKKIEKLSPEENFVLAKIEQAYQAHRQENPDKPFRFELGNEIDRQVFENLSYRLAIEDIKSKQAANDQQNLQKIRENLKIPENQNKEKVQVPEKESEIKRSPEKEKIFQKQINDLIKLAISDEDYKRRADNYRNSRFPGETQEEAQKRLSTSNVEMLSLMSERGLYDLVHKSKLSYKEIVDQIKLPDKEKFIENFSNEIDKRLTEAVANSSKVRRITNEELIAQGKPDQAQGFVWFKGNAPRPSDAREVRFYINASPDGTIKAAEQLAKVSDFVDQYGMRLQFKFRKDLGEYDRTDTCVAYLYMPKPKNEQQQQISDQWIQKIGDSMLQIPKESIRDQNSFFTNRIGGGISSAEDSRLQEGKKGESYTSQITKIIGESAKELSSQYANLDSEAIEAISSRSIEKLRQANYF